jgi:hypothetical protein
VNTWASIEWRFEMAPMKKREGPPQSVYRYGLFLRFSLERGSVDGPPVVTSGLPALLAVSAMVGLVVVQVVLGLVAS